MRITYTFVCGASARGSNGGTQAKIGQLLNPHLVLELSTIQEIFSLERTAIICFYTNDSCYHTLHDSFSDNLRCFN